MASIQLRVDTSNISSEIVMRKVFANKRNGDAIYKNWQKRYAKKYVKAGQDAVRAYREVVPISGVGASKDLGKTENNQHMWFYFRYFFQVENQKNFGDIFNPKQRNTVKLASIKLGYFRTNEEGLTVRKDTPMNIVGSMLEWTHSRSGNDRVSSTIYFLNHMVWVEEAQKVLLGRLKRSA